MFQLLSLLGEFGGLVSSWGDLKHGHESRPTVSCPFILPFIPFEGGRLLSHFLFWAGQVGGRAMRI